MGFSQLTTALHGAVGSGPHSVHPVQGGGYPKAKLKLCK